MSTSSLEQIGQQRVEEWLQNGDIMNRKTEIISEDDFKKTPRDDMDIGTRFGLGARSKSMLRARKLFMEAERVREEKRKMVTEEVNDKWRATIRREIEENLTRQVREALSTPPLERMRRNKERSKQRYLQRLRQLNSHLHLDLTDREREYLRYKRVQHAVQEVKSRARAFSEDNISAALPEETEESARAKYERLYNSAISAQASPSEEPPKPTDPMDNFGSMSRREKNDLYYMFTKRGFMGALRRGMFHNGTELEPLSNGRYRDRYGIMRDRCGPFWPHDYGPLYAAPEHRPVRTGLREPLLAPDAPEPARTHDSQTTCYTARWRGVQTVYDSETSSRNYAPVSAPEACAPSLTFESRFECGNLRQARRIGQFEYELVLQTDLYTKRHTQWYYFQVGNMMAGYTYKIIITNLLKPTSLYNNGMRPLLYSQYSAENGGCGWVRTGHHISYTRNMNNLHSPLLLRDRNYYMLQFQVEFEYDVDTCYFAHCYPYTFTDLRNDLDWLSAADDRRKVVRQDVLCETRAGNACFVLTVTNFEDDASNRPLSEKKCVIVSGRVHPGESNASWMVRGLINFITSNDPKAKSLRDEYVFKVVPMLNPDGVIVGNYRCSLGARDLNRNYRHPRKENFPTIWHVKQMTEEMATKHEVVVYCDFHGHSRKSNVFMYGCDPETQTTDIQSFVNMRLFPWLMAKGAPDKFSFSSCKFRVRRCKESTGRVVMWRQMAIDNSYTMEASFSGTTLDSGCLRHFNTEDLEDMGRVFCQTVLEHQTLKQDQSRHAAAVVDITKSLILQLADSCEESSLQSDNFLQKVEDQLRSDDETKSGEVTSMLVNLLAKDKPAIERQKTRILGQGDNSSNESESATGSDKSMQTIENCFRLLEDLHLADTVLETDSSDSDSESEPEMTKYESPKKKKKKSKKKRDQEKTVRMTQKRNSLGNEPMVLPAIIPEESPVEDKKSGSPSKQRSSRTKSSGPLFISKFEGRHNNGIPCFSEERSMERAARKSEEKMKRMEEQRQRDAELYFLPPRAVTIATINHPTVAMGDQRPSTVANGNDAFGYDSRRGVVYDRLTNQGVNLYSVQFANEGAADDQDGDGDRNYRQMALAIDNMPANVTRAFLRWRSKCLSGGAQDYPMPMSSLHVSALDYAIPEEELSDPDSLESDSDDGGEFAEVPTILPGRRASLPNTSTYRFTYSHQKDSTATKPSTQPKRSDTKHSPPLGKPAKKPSNGHVKTLQPEVMIKDMIVEPQKSDANEKPPAAVTSSGQGEVLALLHSVTSSANKKYGLSQTENSQFFKINNRHGKGVKKPIAESPETDGVKDSEKYRKKRRNSLQKSRTEVDLTEKFGRDQGERIYATNFLKPSPILTQPPVPIQPLLPVVSDTSLESKSSMTRILRARAQETRYGINTTYK